MPAPAGRETVERRCGEVSHSISAGSGSERNGESASMRLAGFGCQIRMTMSSPERFDYWVPISIVD